MRYLAVLFVSVLAASALAAAGLMIHPPSAEAAGNSVKKCGGGRISLDPDERRAFVLHDKERRDHDLKPLCVDPKLQRAAEDHSKDMIRRDYFSHTTKGTNRDGCDRVRKAGYRYRACGENIAWGSGPLGEPENIMRSWMNSDEHRRNILGAKYREVGIGAHTGTYNGNQNATMYTADFGRPR